MDGILDGEFSRARQIQKESVGLKYREIEQAVLATFLHSQPIGQSARTRDLVVLLGLPGGQDRAGEGLSRWAQTSHWLDDMYTVSAEEQLPEPGGWVTVRISPDACGRGQEHPGRHGSRPVIG